ncbi:MAG: CoA-binding protein [Candidatus Solibacter usitatus]|nr:CoA-binding protein [Candidatus Solibacter usitatus]
MSVTTRAAIDEFLALKRIAIVGVSRSPAHFSRMVFKEFAERGYDVVPVNREGGEVDGQPVFRSLNQVSPPVEGALVLSPPDVAASVAGDCRRAGVARLWVYRTKSDCGALVEGECPLMWLKDPAWFHGLHRGLRGIFGRLP